MTRGGEGGGVGEGGGREGGGRGGEEGGEKRMIKTSVQCRSFKVHLEAPKLNL